MHGLGILLASAHEVRELFSEWEEDGLPMFAMGDMKRLIDSGPFMRMTITWW